MLDTYFNAYFDLLIRLLLNRFRKRKVSADGRCPDILKRKLIFSQNNKFYLHFLISLSAIANSAYFKNASELYCKEVFSLLVIISLYIAPRKQQQFTVNKFEEKLNKLIEVNLNIFEPIKACLN